MPPRSSKNRPSRPTQARSTGPAHPDFNELWRTKDLAQLTTIPHNLQGWCGCTICGSKKLVKGSVFRQHMWELHSALPTQPTPSKRIRTSSLPARSQTQAATSNPSTPVALVSSIPLPTIEEPMLIDDPPSLDIGFTYDGGYDADEEFAMGESVTDTEDVETDVHLAVEEGLDGMTQLLARSSLLDIEPRPTPPPSPSPPPSDSAPSPPAIDKSAVTYGRDTVPTRPDDLINKWPHPLPSYLLPPAFSGSMPNPFAHSTSTSQDLPLTSKVLPLLAHTLSGIANVPRRSVELVLQLASLLVSHTRQTMYDRFRQWYVDTHPDRTDNLGELDSKFAPGLGDHSAAPKTAATALKQLQVDDSLIVHPVCKNHDCNHVFYEHIAQSTFPSLPPLCPSCSEPLFTLNGVVDVLHFPRRALQAELEVFFRVPGVENAVERRKERKRHRDQMDSTSGAGGKVYRQQDDGTAWDTAFDRDDALSISVNMSIDWANPSSTRSASSSSMGPFLLQVADLPPQLRGAFCCMMVMGITPAPRQPSPANLWKYLLPLCLELRDAASHGVWVRTPAHPQGRLVRVRLALTCCDRPAAVDITGGGNFKAHDTPCLRCTINHDDLLGLAQHPRRSTPAHCHAIFDQLIAIPQAVRQDQEAWAGEPAFDPVSGKRKSKKYTKERRLAVERQYKKTRGNLSALSLIPGYDIFGSSIFDPMHSILEGCLKSYFFKILQLGETANPTDEAKKGGMSGASTDGGLSTDKEAAGFEEGRRILEEMRQGGIPASRPPEVIQALERDLATIGKKKKGPRKLRWAVSDVTFLQQQIAAVQVPTSVAKLHPLFGTPSAGQPSANDWRTFATVFAPLILPVMNAQRGARPDRVGNPVFSKDELSAQMMLCEITSLALRPTISELQVRRLETLILVWQRLAYKLHPSLRASTNIHVISHLAEDIRAFGPTYGWWCFPGERLNYVVKNTNRSGGNHYQAQVVAMRAVVRSREVVSTRSRTLQVPTDAPESVRELATDVGTLLDGFSNQSAASTLEQVSYMYTEVDRRDLDSITHHSTDRVIVKPRGVVKDGTLDRGTLKKLQDCIKLHGIETSTLASSDATYISSQCQFWPGLIVNGRRLDCADWTNVLSASRDPSSISALSKARNSVFEARPERNRWALQDQNSRSGVLCSVFEHRLRVGDAGEEGGGLYGIVRLFQPYGGLDVYGYREHASLDVWTWDHGVLSEPVIIALRPEILHALRPLALTSLPLDPWDESKGLIWATIPVHQN